MQEIGKWGGLKIPVAHVNVRKIFEDRCPSESRGPELRGHVTSTREEMRRVVIPKKLEEIRKAFLASDSLYTGQETGIMGCRVAHGKTDHTKHKGRRENRMGVGGLKKLLWEMNFAAGGEGKEWGCLHFASIARQSGL